MGGGLLPRFWTPTTPQNKRWSEALLGGGSSGRGNGGGGSGGFCPPGGGASRRVGWGEGVQVGQFGGTCPQGQALVHQRLPLPPLALALTIPSP